MEMMECPICGEKYPEEFTEYLDNGNSACPHHVSAKIKQTGKFIINKKEEIEK